MWVFWAPASKTIERRKGRFPGFLGMVCILLSIAVGGRASAQDGVVPGAEDAVYRGAPLRIVVDKFEGPGAELLRAATLQALNAEERLDVLPIRQYQQASRGLDATKAGYAEVAKRLSLAAIIRAKVVKVGSYRVVLSVIEGETGEIVSRLRFSGDRLSVVQGKLKTQLWGFLGPILLEHQAASAPAAEEEPAPPAAKPQTRAPGDGAARPSALSSASTPPTNPGAAVAPAPPVVEAEPGEVPFFPRPEFSTELRHEVTSPPKAARRCRWLGLEISGGALRRVFEYENEQRGPLRAYLLEKSPVVGATASVYPFALRACEHGLHGLGVRLGYQQMFGAVSHLGGRELATKSRSWEAELGWRLPIAMLRLTPFLGYRARIFRVQGDAVPGVAYHTLRANLELGAELGPVFGALAGGGGYVLGAGEIAAADWFAKARGFNAGGEARLGVRFLKVMSVLVGASFELYQLSFDIADDAEAPHGVAGGSRDRYLTAWGALRFELDE